MEISVYGKRYLKMLDTSFSPLISLHFPLLQSNRFNLHAYSRQFCQSLFIELPSLRRNEKFTCDICDTQTTSLILHVTKKVVLVVHCYVPSVQNFSTKSQNDLNYHIAKKHNGPKPDDTFKCKHSYQEFIGFYGLGQHRNTEHGFPIKTANVDLGDNSNKVDEASLKEELRSSQHFLVYSELERGRHKFFKVAIEKVNTKLVLEKLDHFFNNTKCAAKVNLAYGFILRNVVDGGLIFFLRRRKHYPAGSI